MCFIEASGRVWGKGGWPLGRLMRAVGLTVKYFGSRHSSMYL